MNEVYIKIPDYWWATHKYFKDKDFITVEELCNAFDTLCDDYQILEEKHEDFKEYVESNYKPMTVEEQVGWTHNW